MAIKKVAMIGVGKLGQDCAEVMADYYDVVGYDVELRTPTFPMCNTIQEAVSGRDIIFIAAPTPHNPIYGGETPTSHLPNKDFDYTIVTDILKEVNKWVNKNQLVVLISTVLPGTVRNQLRPCITNARFIYNPYLIAMGTIKWDMANPEMVIIGTEDGSITGDAAELIHFYEAFMQNDPRYEVGTWDEAESIKIFYNTFISAKVGIVNMIQDVAEKNGNINVDVVTGALARSNYRITGPAYMTAGMGDGGACVLPSFTVTVNDEMITMEELYDKFNSTDKFMVVSTTADCSRTDQKTIKAVTKTPFSGEMIKFNTFIGDLIVTDNHLLPIERDGVHMLTRADEVLHTDKLFVIDKFT